MHAAPDTAWPERSLCGARTHGLPGGGSGEIACAWWVLVATEIRAAHVTGTVGNDMAIMHRPGCGEGGEIEGVDITAQFNARQQKKENGPLLWY